MQLPWEKTGPILMVIGLQLYGHILTCQNLTVFHGYFMGGVKKHSTHLSFPLVAIKFLSGNDCSPDVFLVFSPVIN